MKILVSGFKPFLGQSVNPSEKLATDLAKIFSFVRAVVLPVEYDNAFRELQIAASQEKPDLILMIGQARGRQKINLEKVGLNWIQSRFNDEKNENSSPRHILVGQELALMTKAPVDKWIASVPEIDISFSAGTFVCNELYFRVLAELGSVPSAFIHVPLLPEQMATEDHFSMEYDTQLATLKKLVNHISMS